MAKDEGFLNVDLELAARTRAQLTPLVEQFNGKFVELFHGRVRSAYLVCYESCGPSSIQGRLNNRNATAVIHELADVIEGLNATGRRAWNAIAKRDFNVGVELARGVWTLGHVIEADAVRRVAALQGRLVFTAYQPAALRRPTSRRRRSMR